MAVKENLIGSIKKIRISGKSPYFFSVLNNFKMKVNIAKRHIVIIDCFKNAISNHIKIVGYLKMSFYMKKKFSDLNKK